MNGDFEKFFRQNQRRIHFQIRRLGITGDLYDEFYAEGMIALWEAYQTYEVKKGDVGTFINYKIRYRLIDLLRKKTRQKESLDYYVLEKRTELTDGNHHRATQMPLISHPGIVLKDKRFWEEIRSRLTEKQWKWVEYFIIADLTIKEIMEIENVSADTVKSWGKAVRKKLRNEELKRRIKEMM